MLKDSSQGLKKYLELLGAIIKFPCFQQYISNTIPERWKETWSRSLQLPCLDLPSLGSWVWPSQPEKTRYVDGLWSQSCCWVTINQMFSRAHAGSKATFPRQPFLSPSGCRYSPHKDADPLKPREPAIIERFIAYKNQDHGAWLRGGDVWLDNCQWVLPYFNSQSSAWCLWQA